MTNIEPIGDNGCASSDNEQIGINVHGVAANELVISKRRSRYTTEDFEMAIQAVKSGAMNRFKAALTFGIPKTTLFRMVDADGNIKSNEK